MLCWNPGNLVVRAKVDVELLARIISLASFFILTTFVVKGHELNYSNASAQPQTAATVLLDAGINVERILSSLGFKAVAGGFGGVLEIGL